jgi:hypothetical protein
LFAVLAPAALLSLMWYVSRARTGGRWRAALDRYVEREEAKRTYSRRKMGMFPDAAPVTTTTREKIAGRVKGSGRVS